MTQLANKKPKIINSANCIINNVVLKGVKPKNGSAVFSLHLITNENANPSIYLTPLTGEGVSTDETKIKLDDGLPLPQLFGSAISTEFILDLVVMGETLSDILITILSCCVMGLAKLTVSATKGKIRFLLKVGDFQTEAKVNPDRVKEYLILA